MSSRQQALALLFSLALGFAGAAEAKISIGWSPIRPHADDPRTPAGFAQSRLIRNDEGIAVRIWTNHLDQAAYTVWWVLFNNPQYCASAPCTASDLPANGGDPRVEASIAFATSDYVGRNGSGRFGAGLGVGDTSRALFGPGLLNAHVAEVHMVIRWHGPTDPHTAHLQLSMVNGGCPEGGCRDQQFAIHP